MVANAVAKKARAGSPRNDPDGVEGNGLTTLPISRSPRRAPDPLARKRSDGLRAARRSVRLGDEEASTYRDAAEVTLEGRPRRSVGIRRHPELTRDAYCLLSP